MVNNINKNTVNEILARKNLNALNKIKNAEIKNKHLISKQNKLSDFFNNLLDTILTKNENNNNNNNNNENEYENENDNIIKQLNDSLVKIIDKSKSFEDQIKLFKKVKDLNMYCYISHYNDKELKFKKFKVNLADLSNNIDKKLFEQIFGDTFVALVNKLINTTNKEENQIIVNDIQKN